MLENIAREMGYSGVQAIIFIISFVVASGSILAYYLKKPDKNGHKKEIGRIGFISLGVMAADMITPFIPIVAILILIAIPLYKKFFNKGP